MRIYISGGITNNPNAFADFMRAKTYLEKKYPDAYIINPVKVASTLPSDFTHSEYMAVMVDLLCLSDMVYFIKGWENSDGARAENAIATKLYKNGGRGNGFKIEYEKGAFDL